MHQDIKKLILYLHTKLIIDKRITILYARTAFPTQMTHPRISNNLKKRPNTKWFFKIKSIILTKHSLNFWMWWQIHCDIIQTDYIYYTIYYIQEKRTKLICVLVLYKIVKQNIPLSSECSCNETYKKSSKWYRSNKKFFWYTMI